MKKIRLLYGMEATQGGSLKHLIYLITSISQNDFEITVVLSSMRETNLESTIKKIQAAGSKVILLPLKRRIAPISDTVNFIRILKIMVGRKFDVVHAHSSKAGVLFRLAGWLCKVPLILYTPHCFYFQAHHSKIKKRFFIWVDKMMAKITDKIIVSKNEQAAALEARICSYQKLCNINNAIKFDESVLNLDVERIKQKYEISTSLVVGAVGRLTKQKDWYTFIHAANEVIQWNADVTFVIAGEGEQRKELEALISSLNLADKVKLIGYIEDIDEIYAILDVYVNSSLWEGLPYTYIEAMHHRKPVIATEQGETDILEEGETGYIVAKRNYSMLAEKLSDLLGQKKKMRSFGEKSKKRILQYKYSFDRFVREHEKLYRINICM